jgi:hypothetical protein
LVAGVTCTSMIGQGKSNKAITKIELDKDSAVNMGLENEEVRGGTEVKSGGEHVSKPILNEMNDVI